MTPPIYPDSVIYPWSLLYPDGDETVVNPTYEILIAWGGDVSNLFTIGVSTLGGGDQLAGDWAVTFDGDYDDVTLDTEEFKIDRGRDDPLSDVQAGTCDLTLFDLDGKYNPEDPSSPIYGQMVPMRQIKLTAIHPDGTPYVLFRGFLRTADYDPKTFRCKLHFEDLLTYLSRVKPVIAPTSGTTGFLINAILEAVGWDIPELIDVDVTKGDDVANFSMEGTEDSRSALQGIADLLESERGLFFIARDGTATYIDRNTQITKASSGALEDVFVNVFPGVSLDNIINDATVTKEGGTPQNVTDDASQSVYGPSTESISSPYFEDDAQAANLAGWLIFLYSTPTNPVWALPMVGNINPDTLHEVLSREIGDHITVTSTQVGFSDGSFFVESVSHAAQSAARHEASWSLTKRPGGDTGGVFAIGQSALGGGDILGY